MLWSFRAHALSAKSRPVAATMMSMATLFVAACSGAPERPEIDGVASTIVGGSETPPCSWPSVGAYFGGTNNRCTATLIHPQLITLASHCLLGGDLYAVFGDTIGQNGGGPTDRGSKVVPIKSCMARPGGVNAGEDFAFCILSEPIKDIPIIPVLFGCEEQVLKTGTAVTMVGFGDITGNMTGDAPDNIHKRSVNATVKSFPADHRSISAGDATHTVCLGDSGGPLLTKLDDGSWRMFGATSTTAASGGGVCNGAGSWAYVPHYIAWAEQQSGFDLTPCWDAQSGAFDPGPSCTGAPTNADMSEGTWAKMCTENVTRGGLPACGGDGGAPSRDAAAPTSDARDDARNTGVGGGSGRDGGGAGTGADAAGGSAGAGNGGAAGGGGAAGAGTAGAIGTGGGGAAGEAGARGGGSAGSGGSAGATGTGGGVGGNGNGPPGTGGTHQTITDPAQGGCDCRFAGVRNASSRLGWLVMACAAGLCASRRRRSRALASNSPAAAKRG